MRTQFMSIQYLRGIAALLVVAAHTTEYPLPAGVEPAYWTGRTGSLGVQVFFVISGFIISTVTGPGRFDPVQFAWRRLIRIVPLYWLCTGLLIALTLVGPALFKTTATTPAHAFLSLLFIPHPDPGLSDNYWSPLLKPGWTLNIEMFFYGLTALLFWCRTRHLRAGLLTLGLGALAVLSFADMRAYGVLDFYASSNLFAFIAGIWLAETHVWSRVGNRGEAWLRWSVGLAAAAAVLVVYGVETNQREVHLTLLAAPLVVLFAVLQEEAGALPTWPWLKRIGDASYSLYLTHMFSVGLAWVLIRKLVGPSEPALSAVGIPVSIAVAVAIALTSYRFLEKPTLRLAQGRRATPATVKTAVLADADRVTSGSARPGTTTAPWRATRA